LKTAEFVPVLLLLAVATLACEAPSGGRHRRPAPAPSPDPQEAPPADEPSKPLPVEEDRLTEAVRVKVVDVRDAGTLDVRKDGRRRRVRLLGITAPRPPGRKEPEQRYGAEAKAYVEEQILDRHVRLRFLRGHPKDTKDRLLAYVLIEGRDFNAKLVRRGCAWADAGGDHPRRDEYRKLEKEARKARRGMWGAD